MSKLKSLITTLVKSKFSSRRTVRKRRVLHAEFLEARTMFAGLLHEADLTYVGAFRVPQSPSGASTFAYGGTAPAFNPANNSLFLVGHDWDQAVAEISIPQIVNSTRITDLRTATVLQPFQQVQPRVPSWSMNSVSKIGGLEVVNNQLVGTFFEFYDGDYSATKSHFKLSSLNLSSSSVTGLHQVGNLGGGYVGGYMTPVPLEWQDELGMPYLTGQAALSIIGRTSAGPAAFGFNPNSLGSSTATASPLVYYPLSSPLRPEASTNPLFNLTTEINGVVFPENSESIIFFGSHGTGQYCYGEAAECNDSARSGKGTHSVGGQYEYQAWAYSVHDFIAVKNGVKQPWEIQPYDVWTFDMPFDHPAKHVGGVSYDKATNRIFLSQKSADFNGFDPFPIINVFQLPNGGSTNTQGPVITGVAARNLTDQSATIQWQTDVASSSQVEYGLTSALGSITTLDANLVTSHSVQLNGLQAERQYFYRVRSRGANSVETVSPVSSFTTLASSSSNSSIYSWSNPKPLPPADPATSVTVTNVSQLVNAVNNLRSGQTILIAPGTYNLSGVTDGLYVPQGITNWSIRGATGKRDDVVIRGGGMTGTVRFGFWVGSSTNGTIADLTIDGIREHGIIANPGAHDMLYHGLRMVDTGDQFIKSNPASASQGNDRGIVEYSIFEYRTMAPDNYTNGVDVHGGDDWIVRYNMFRNILSPAGQPVAGPAVLFWNGSTNTNVEGNTFVNTARGISLGLEDKAGFFDHQGGKITNNMFTRAANLGGPVDVPIYIADSPDTKVYNNSILDLGTYPNAIEYRFASTSATDIRNNLANRNVVARDGAVGTVSSNLLTATSSLFVNAASGDLHLLSTATTVINRGVNIVANSKDLDAQQRDSLPDIGADELVTSVVNQPPQISPQVFSVNENSALGTVVGTILATDPEQQALTFTLLSGNTSSAFVLDSATGVLRVNSATALNFEVLNRYELQVQARDAGGLTSSALVTINVNNVNESPIVSNQTFSVNSIPTVGQTVGTIVATDPDANSVLTFSITGGNANNAFSVDASTGVIRIVTPWASGTQPPTFVVTVRDQGNLSSSATITVNAALPPRISPQSFSINENSASGTIVGTISASDPEQQSLTFTLLSGNTGTAFVLDSVTGVLRVNSSTALNFEVLSRFDLQVQVRDTTGLTSSALVTVNVNNVNESPVVQNQTFSVTANPPAGQTVGTIVATDPDANSVLTFAITSGNANNTFSVDASTGTIRVVTPWATGTQPPTFVVTVRDQGGLSSSATVTVNSVIPTSNLVSHFPMNEGSGTATYDQNRRTATLNGPVWTTGKGGSGLRFDGVNDMATVPDSNDLDFTTAFTLAMWVNPTSLGNWRTGILKERPNGLAYGLYVSDDRSRPAGYVTIGGREIGVFGPKALTLNTWSHIATTFNGRNLTLFVNGVQVAQVSAVGSAATSASPLRFGGNVIWGEYFAGAMDDVKLFKTALTATEVANLAATTASAPLSGALSGALAASTSTTLAPSASSTVSLDNTPSIASSQLDLSSLGSDSIEAPTVGTSSSSLKRGSKTRSSSGTSLPQLSKLSKLNSTQPVAAIDSALLQLVDENSGSLRRIG